ncbi:disrupted in schizophrenia 1 protein-like [Carlito syrichta]|uniref:Disrupted in schizophrenia 1 protein-like n=1 Tax=Carlito syrichta TaxID=1868482 RepID=A0A3Q0EBJ3_CARSF|nr:disrupted in schizophrenia 1 protein-like [Carlito syrichta]
MGNEKSFSNQELIKREKGVKRREGFENAPCLDLEPESWEKQGYGSSSRSYHPGYESNAEAQSLAAQWLVLRVVTAGLLVVGKSVNEPLKSTWGESLQERIKSLNVSLKEITTKVSMSERFCSTLRKKVNDIETQLPALLEAKMLAISGNHFCTAKDLTEEIRSLTSEREGLEGLLNKLLVLSSRNVKKLGSVQEDYSRLRRELEHQETAYETNVKENTVKYMEILEAKLCSCKYPLLGKVWEADLEACRLLIQSLQLREARGSLSGEDQRQMNDTEGAACTTTPAMPLRLQSHDERKTHLQALEEWQGHLSPALLCPGGEQKEESYILSAELGEKCEAIGQRLLYLEDQLHMAIHNHDEDLIQSLKRELQMVKETLQAMILQLQPAKEEGEGETAASCVTAGVREAQA